MAETASPEPEDKSEEGDTSDKDAVLKEGRDRADAAYLYDKDNRDQAIIDLRFLAGDMWPDDERQRRADAFRPCLTLDRLSQNVFQVTNDIRQAKIGMKAIPVDNKGDPDLADKFTGLIRDIQYQSHAPYVYAYAAGGAVGCGIGHFRYETRYMDDSVFDQEIVIKPIPYHLAVLWDPAAVEPDRSDAKWCHVLEFQPTADFKKQHPKAKEVDINVPREPGVGGLNWATQDGVLKSEYWRKVPSKRRLVAFEDGSVFDLTDVKPEMMDMLPPIVGEREADGFKVEQYLMTGAEILEGPNEWAGRYFPIIPVIGREVNLETKVVREGLIRKARDAQLLYNYQRSASAEAIALAPKATWLVTAKMIATRKQEWENAHLGSKAYLTYEPDEKAPTGKPERVDPPVIPQALWKEAALAIDDIKAATGIYDASLGAAGNEKSGVAIQRRQQEGDVSTFDFSDNLQRSLEHAGRVLIDLIPKIYDSERVIRLLGEDDEHTFEPINTQMYDENGEPVLYNNLAQGRFDIRVSIGPSYTTQRLEAADQMLEYIKADPESLPIIRDLLMRNMDWPESAEIAERFKKLVPPQVLGEDEQPEQQPQDPNAGVQNDLANKDAGAKIAKTEGEARKAHAEADHQEMENQLEAAQLEALTQMQNQTVNPLGF